MEVGTVAEASKHVPEERLSAEDIKGKSPNLIAAMYDLARLNCQDAQDDKIISSKKDSYKWTITGDDGGGINSIDKFVELTESSDEKNIHRKIILNQTSISAIRTDPLNKETSGYYHCDLKALNEVKKVMRHLVGNIRGDTETFIEGKKLSQKDIKEKSPKLLAVIYHLAKLNLQDAQDENVITSENGRYRWTFFGDKGGFESDNKQLQIAEKSLEEGVERKVLITPTSIAASYLDLKSKKMSEYFDTPRVLSEVKNIMRHLVGNIKAESPNSPLDEKRYI
jgi:hypothetical protein